MATKIHSDEISPDDFLVAMAHYLPKGRKCFRYDPEKLNNFFYKQQQKYPKTLSVFGFNQSGLWPTSEELSQAISNMFACALIIVTSNTPWHYNFGPECEAAYQEFAKGRIPKERLSDIEAIARDFNEQIATDETLSVRR